MELGFYIVPQYPLSRLQDYSTWNSSNKYHFCSVISMLWSKRIVHEIGLHSRDSNPQHLGRESLFLTIKPRLLAIKLQCFRYSIDIYGAETKFFVCVPLILFRLFGTKNGQKWDVNFYWLHITFCKWPLFLHKKKYSFLQYFLKINCQQVIVNREFKCLLDFRISV